MRNGGAPLYAHYDTLREALKALYPGHPWAQHDSHTERRTPYGYWQDQGHLFAALEKVQEKLGISQVHHPFPFPHLPSLFRNRFLIKLLLLKPEDWYSVTLSQLKELAVFPSEFTKSHLVKLLSEKYPEHKWDKIYLLRGKYAQQKRLERAVASLFPV